MGRLGAMVVAVLVALGSSILGAPQQAQAAAPVIATTSTINAGAVNPVVSVTTSSSVFAAGVSVADFTITTGSTGLAGAPAFTRVSDTHVSFAFTGTAAAGEVSITAGAGAFNPDPGAGSNTVTITVPAAVNASSAPAAGSLAIVVDTNLTPNLTITLWGDLAGRSKDWGDGTAVNTSSSHTYTAAGFYTIEFAIPSGSLLPIENCEYSCLDGLVDVTQWGNSIVGPNAFEGAQNLTGFTATDAPAVAVEPTSMFKNATRFNGNINSWNVSGVQRMNSMFEGATAFNQPLNNWNTSSVLQMSNMFNGATAFNQPLNSWNVSSVTNMSGMFNGATAFNQPLNDWNTSPNSTSQVTSMSHMFEGATSFNQPLNNWNTSNVENMSNMFRFATAFNQPLNNWNTSKVTDMRHMFKGATAFNENIGTWDTRSVTNMGEMFQGATAFNQPLNSWTPAQDMRAMFRYATAFNQPLNMWDTSNVAIMRLMFVGATAFNQPLDKWNLGLVTNMEEMLQDASAMGVANWSATLIGWAKNPPTPSSTPRGNVRAEGLFYSADAQVAHDSLIGRGLSNLGSMVPAPPPVFPPSGPRDVVGVPGDREVAVSWQPPVSVGSFPVTDYLVTAGPGGQTCLAKAPALTCTVTGLANGTAYTFVVTALNGAGWGAGSQASAPVTPSAQAVRSLTLFQGTRAADGRHDRITTGGTSVGVPVGSRLTPWIRYGATGEFKEGVASIVVDDKGGFTWTRQIRKDKAFHAYVAFEDLESNRVIWQRVR